MKNIILLLTLTSIFNILELQSQRLITVSADGTGDFKTISSAIANAVDGDIIDIYGTITGDGLPDYGIIVDKNLIIRGQGIENTIIQASTKRGDPTINQRIFTISPGAVVIIEHLSIRNGYLHGQNAKDKGAAIQNYGHLVLNDCKIYGNFVKVEDDYHEGHVLNHRSGFLSVDKVTEAHMTLYNSSPNSKTQNRN